MFDIFDCNEAANQVEGVSTTNRPFPPISEQEGPPFPVDGLGPFQCDSEGECFHFGKFLFCSFFFFVFLFVFWFSNRTRTWTETQRAGFDASMGWFGLVGWWVCLLTRDETSEAAAVPGPTAGRRLKSAAVCVEDRTVLAPPPRLVVAALWHAGWLRWQPPNPFASLTPTRVISSQPDLNHPDPVELEPQKNP